MGLRRRTRMPARFAAFLLVLAFAPPDRKAEAQRAELMPLHVVLHIAFDDAVDSTAYIRSDLYAIVIGSAADAGFRADVTEDSLTATVPYAEVRIEFQPDGRFLWSTSLIRAQSPHAPPCRSEGGRGARGAFRTGGILALALTRGFELLHSCASSG